MKAVSNAEHLRNVEIRIRQKELPLKDKTGKQLPPRWKQDPLWSNRNYGAPPGSLVFTNGVQVSEFKTGYPAKTSRTPFPERRVPRRGIKVVNPDDPDYVRLCHEQGLEHLLDGVEPFSTSCLENAALTPVTPGNTEPTDTKGGLGCCGPLPNGVNGHAE